MEIDDQPDEGSLPEPLPSSDADAPPADAVLHLDQYSEYLLHSPRDILAVLRQVADQADLITLYFNSGKDFLLTTLLAVNDRELLLDRGSSADMNRRALEADKIFCITRHDKVKLQFILPGVRETRHEGRSVFVAILPETLLRLQRREYFRLHTPIARPLICRIPVVMTDGSVDIYAHNVIDISLGGLSLQVGDVPFVAEQEWHDCTIDLPQIGIVNATLKVLNFYAGTLRNGQPSTRVGCQFVDMPATSQNLIQRYIVRTERERKARESGLA
ncbi:MAG: flagellar brake protein [Rhodocyclaceae bacterium]|nr:flagellar brake protein [Rhodocyclaceae bacterium]